MHDIGKVVLAANFDEQYRGAQSLARKQGLPLSEVEKEIFGASHGEIGAYLLGLWGMPLDLLEVAALHHLPSGGITQGFTPLTAVHLANALEHETNPDKEDSAIASKIDQEYLAQIGLLDRLDTWRTAVKNKNFTNPAPKARTANATAAKSAPAKAKAAEPAAKRPVRREPATAAQPALAGTGGPKLDAAWLSQHRRRVFAGMGLGAFALMVAWLVSGPFGGPAGELDAPKAVQAATNAAAAAPEVAGAPAATSDSSTENVSTPEKAGAASPTPGTLVVRARTASADPAAGASDANDLTLQGIFYNSKNPTAIISGRTVRQNDRLGGALVVEITPTGVTLEYQNQRKKLTLK